MLLRCHQCGLEIKQGSGMQKAVKTGKFTTGGDFFRKVNFCQRCAETMLGNESAQKQQRLVIWVGIVLLVAVAVAYLMFFR
jgi:hypothetical protein